MSYNPRPQFDIARARYFWELWGHMSQREIGAKVGLSPARVHQIIAQYRTYRRERWRQYLRNMAGAPE